MSRLPANIVHFSRDSGTARRYSGDGPRGAGYTDKGRGMNAEAVKDRISNYLTRDEKVERIALQKPMIPLPMAGKTAIVLTTRRVFIFHAKMFGLSTSFEDYLWHDLHDARIKEGPARATISMQSVSGPKIEVDSLDKDEARALYRAAQEREEEARDYRHKRQVEANRVNIHGAATP